MPLQPGDRAPEFQLYDTDRKLRTLKEFLGKKTVLAFFPGAFTSVCTREMCRLRDSMRELNELQAQIIGISVDAPAANKAFSVQNGLQFPILSDYSRTAVKAYDVELRNFGGLPGLTAAQRSVFILDAGGVVRYAWVAEDPGVEPKYEEVTRAVASLGS